MSDHRPAPNGHRVASRLGTRVLRWLTSRDRSEAILGDVREDAIARGGAPWVQRFRAEGQVWRHIWAAALEGVPTLARVSAVVLRDASRGLRGSRRYLASALAVLTLGMAAATVTFSVVDAVALRPFPFAAADRLAVVTGRTQLMAAQPLSAQELVALRDRSRTFVSIAGVRRSTVEVEFEPGAETTIAAARATASLFTVLGRRPIAGQTFGEDRETAGRDDVAVLGHRLWVDRFGADANVIGRTIRVGGRAVDIIGVMPPGFSYPVVAGRPVELWMPYVMDEDERAPENVGTRRQIHVVGRLRDTASWLDAKRDVEAIMAALAPLAPRAFQDWRPDTTPLVDSLIGRVRGWMVLVLWAVGLVVLVAAFNSASLMLTRSAVRHRERAIRAALGASAAQQAATSLVEGVAVSVCASALGLLASRWGTDVARAALPPGIIRADTIAIDTRVIVMAVAAAAIVGLIVGIAPAWRAWRTSARGITGALRPAPRRGLAPALLLTGQMAFVTVLLVTTALFVVSFVRVTSADLGFERSGLVSVGQIRGYPGGHAALARELREVPGVEDVAAIAVSPPLLGGLSMSTALQPPEAVDASPVTVRMHYVSPEYFAVARIPLRSGRPFDEHDASAARPLVIDELTARALFQDGDPIGRIVPGPLFKSTFRVAGVVSSVRAGGPETSPGPQVYAPIRADFASPQFLVRTSTVASTVVPRIESRLRQIVPGGRPPTLIVLDEVFRQLTAGRRFNAGLMFIFGLLALLTGAAGVYGVVSASVAQQRRDLSVRVALGATGRRIVAGVLGHVGRQIALGLSIGLIGAWWVSRGFATLLFDVAPGDVGVYGVVAATILATGLLAALLPARRAARVDPILALRAE